MKLTVLFIISLFLIIFSCEKNSKMKGQQLEDLEYDASTSYELMLLNDFTYDNTAQTSTNYDTIKTILEREILQNTVTEENQLIWLGITPSNNNLTYVVRKKTSDSNTLSIISRGTILSLIDILEDAEVYRLVNWNDKVSSNIKISEGINSTLQRTMSLTSKVFGSQNTMNKEITLTELLSDEIKSNPNTTTLYVTGHSLGGALTTGLALRIVEDFYDSLQQNRLSIATYDFAGQTVGNDFFKEYYAGFLSDSSISFAYNRIINPFDVVPFAFDNLEGVENIGYPYSEVALLEVRALIESINIAFSLESNNYMHVGGEPVKLEATLPPPNCNQRVENISVFGCWIAYEHQPFHYVDLLTPPQ